MFGSLRILGARGTLQIVCRFGLGLFGSFGLLVFYFDYLPKESSGNFIWTNSRLAFAFAMALMFLAYSCLTYLEIEKIVRESNRRG